MTDYRELIRNKRQSMGISQYDLAQRLGVTQTFISEIERGRKSPSVEVLFAICEVLEIRLFPEES